MFTDFGMDTISLAGPAPLPAKLAAMREAGFTQVMLAARDLVGDFFYPVIQMTLSFSQLLLGSS